MARFNAIWSYCLQEVPFYRAWSVEHGLPSAINQVAELAAFPALTKKLMTERYEEVFQHGAIKTYYSTGGSTGEPVKYPRGAADADSSWANTYLGRSWWGIRPFDPHVLMWGHSHLFGSGVRGRIKQLKRRIADHALRITRLDAYDLSEAALRADYDAIRRKDPVFVIGYTSTVFRLATFMEGLGLEMGDGTSLRGVVVTAETASDADIAKIEEVFRAPVIIEYGAAETGVIATSRGGSRPLQMLWDSFICLAREEGQLHLTTIEPRLFPLINYAIGDVGETGDGSTASVLKLDRVVGRSQDTVKVMTKHGQTLTLSAILPVHILKLYGDIVGIQFKQHKDDRLSIFIEAGRPIDLEDMADYFRRELQKDHPDFDEKSVAFHQVETSQKTLAGKHRLFVE